ncbi:MAG: hypothetical protein WDZ85_01755 [Candidatus Paceibacterota bacterium]
MEPENLPDWVWWTVTGLGTMLGLLGIILGWRNSLVPWSAYVDQSHPQHNRAQTIYGTHYDGNGLPHKGENNWPFMMTSGWYLLSWVLALLVIANPHGFFTQISNSVSQWQFVAKVYLASHLFVVPIFFYFGFFSLVSTLMVGIFNQLTEQPVIEYGPPPSRSKYQPKPPGCRFPGDYYSGEE